VVQMRGLLVVCDTRTTRLSLRLDPRVLLYHDPPTSTLQHHFDMFIRMDHILHQTPAHITALLSHFFVRTSGTRIYLNGTFCVREGHCMLEKDVTCGVSQGRVFGGRFHQRL
jgi:hypothetical protein